MAKAKGVRIITTDHSGKRTVSHMSKAKGVRRIAPLELAQLKKLAKPLTAAFEELQDAQLVVNTKKAAHDALRIPFVRFADNLVKKHKVADGWQINQETGVIEKVGGKK